MGQDPGPFVMSMQPQPSGFRLAFHIKATVVEVDALVLTVGADQKVIVVIPPGRARSLSRPARASPRHAPMSRVQEFGH
jgi:hypothetical protein